MIQSELELLEQCGLVRVVARSQDGKITQYELTGNGRILAKGGNNSQRDNRVPTRLLRASNVEASGKKRATKRNRRSS